MPVKPRVAEEDRQRMSLIRVTTASRTTRPCDACGMFEWCEVAEVACQDFGAWVHIDQRRSLRREPTPGLFNLIFERPDAEQNSTYEDQALFAEILRDAKWRSRAANRATSND